MFDAVLDGGESRFVFAIQGQSAIAVVDESFERRVWLQRVGRFLEFGVLEEKLARELVQGAEMKGGAEEVQEGAGSVNEITSVVVDIVKGEVALADPAQLVNVAFSSDADGAIFATDTELLFETSAGYCLLGVVAGIVAAIGLRRATGGT